MREGIKIILKGRPITKKNSQQIVLTKNGQRFIIQSKQYRAYEKDCLWQIKAQYRGETITDKLILSVHYYMPDRRVPDLINLLQATADILERARVIEDDKNIISFNGSRIMGVDKGNPRVEIEIKKPGSDPRPVL